MKIETQLRPEKNLSRHILPTSATMAGVCMTVITLVKLFPSGRAGTMIDKVLAFDSLLFLGSAIFSYLSMRAGPTAERLETRADLTFLAGLILLVAAAFLLSFELI